MKHILIVDDEQDHRLLLRTILESRGYICEEAEDGVSALEKVSHVSVDLVVTDLNMPRMNGLELIEILAEHPSYQTIPTILVTSQDIDNIQTFGLKENLFAVLPKPFEWERILATIDMAMKRTGPAVSLAG